ncbi:MAG TPA: hypothetical protein VE466_01445, partial [Acidimicrobiales bacterium]|nr:hypothetical protein [Acidimicrobiales bacterium]
MKARAGYVVLTALWALGCGAAEGDCYYRRRRNSRDHLLSKKGTHMAVADLDLGRYKLGWSDEEDYVFKPKKGL